MSQLRLLLILGELVALALVLYRLRLDRLAKRQQPAPPQQFDPVLAAAQIIRNAELDMEEVAGLLTHGQRVFVQGFPYRR